MATVETPIPARDAGRLHSAILVPVPEAEALVGAWRALHDPVASAGVPAHITLVVPWIPPPAISEKDLRRLEELVGDQSPFDYDLDQVCWFGRRVLWLAPRPAEPFVRLTDVLAGAFDTPPYCGEFDEIVPHLTVGHATEDAELEEVAKALDVGLPLRCRAREVAVMCGDGERWQIRHRIALGG